MGKGLQETLRTGCEKMSGIKTGEEIRRFMADFETLTGKDVVDETYVWASGICSIDNPYDESFLKIWNNDEDLYLFLSQFSYSECYFHNLKFDGHFIMHYLLSHGYVYDEDLSTEKTFNTLITDTGQWYMKENQERLVHIILDLKIA